MIWRRTVFVLVIPTIYVACVMLVGTLLGSKTGAGPMLTPPQMERAQEAEAFAQEHRVQAKYDPADLVDLLDAGPAEMKFSTREELATVLDHTACRDALFYFQGTLPARPEGSVPNEQCLLNIRELETYDKDFPTAYFVLSACYPLGPVARYSYDSYRYSFAIRDAQACLETSATAIKWKGYFGLKTACQAEAERIHPQYANEKPENLVRHCIAENARKWHARERERCNSRQVWTTRSCKF